jgi:uncharacterized damage-inducible protein DinB
MTIRWDQAFIDYSCSKLKQLTDRIGTCLDQLSHDQIWLRGSENENAVGNIVLHLCGNVRQWIGFGVGGRPDVRIRDLEFAARGGAEAIDLKERLCTAVAEAISVIRPLTPERLEQTTTIQAYEVSVLQAVYHVVEHFSGHAGQIIFFTKHCTGKDLAFYAHLRSGQPHKEKAP